MVYTEYDVWVFGSTLDFTLLSSLGSASGLLAIPTAWNEIALSWAKDPIAPYTLILYKASTGYPASQSDGVVAYLGEMSSALVQGLKAGTTYYFRAWSYDGVSYSATSMTAQATTPAGNASGLLTPPTDYNPITPSTTKLANMPGYEVAQFIATSMHFDTDVFIRVAILLLVALFSIGVAVLSESMLVTILVTLALSAGAVTIGVMPLFAVVLYGFVAVSIAYIKGAQSYA
jgi:hypothetical protein